MGLMLITNIANEILADVCKQFSLCESLPLVQWKHFGMPISQHSENELSNTKHLRHDKEKVVTW